MEMNKLRREIAMAEQRSVQMANRQLRTEYTEYAVQVNQFVQELYEALASSCNKVNEYQALLSVAAREDIGSTYRMEELERKWKLAESQAKHIYDRGMEMKQEYVDEISYAPWRTKLNVMSRR